jgi:hypothetical protein
MSLGIFRSIHRTYGPKDRRVADKLIRQLNVELMARGLPKYEDPDPGERNLRRLPCGNAGASTFRRLEEIAAEARLSWTLGRLRGERMIVLPIEFAGTLSVTFGRVLFFAPTIQDFASLHTVHQELIALAVALKIPLTDGTLSHALSERLCDCLGVNDHEPAGWLENERALWLDLYYATRYCMEDSRPVVIR